MNNCHACCEETRLRLNFVEAAALRNLGTTLDNLIPGSSDCLRIRQERGLGPLINSKP